MHLKVGPTGKLIKGHLYDVNRKSLEVALKNFDPFLYLVWNPMKRRGLGCWELRRRAEKKTLVHQGEHAGHNFFSLEAVEIDHVNHVYDLPFLSYDVLDKLKAFDMWADKYWVKNFESEEQAREDAIRARARSEMRYNLKQDRSTFRVFKDMVASGVNPALLAQFWGQSP